MFLFVYTKNEMLVYHKVTDTLQRKHVSPFLNQHQSNMGTDLHLHPTLIPRLFCSVSAEQFTPLLNLRYFIFCLTPFGYIILIYVSPLLTVKTTLEKERLSIRGF